MKKYKFLCLLLFFCLFSWFSFGYQQQWFSQYQEWPDWISFSCQNQCVITLWQKDKIDYLELNWNVKWNGFIAYWFLVWDQISLLNQYEVVVSADINDSMNFVEYKQYFSTIPWNTNLILLVDGNLNWNVKIDSGKFSFGKKLSQWWKNFRNFDSFKPEYLLLEINSPTIPFILKYFLPSLFHFLIFPSYLSTFLFSDL